ncbi:uncharacterized protein [Periplaneta americana]|uniref:uncharacterized protein isoform X2 n=1 Tax=Periplaneta americana TaxID=6978 RepID=UPI0037E8E8D5
MSAFNEHQFEKRLQLLKDSQESIQSLSSWCLQHRQHHKKIVGCWLRILKKVKIEHRLTLFYLANDVIQYSKRKNYEFVESWGTALQRATPMVREEKVKNRVQRIFKIWDERGIYDEAFIADLSGLLTTTTKKPANDTVHDTSDFQPPLLMEKIRSCKKLEDDTDLKLKRLNESHLCFTDADALRTHLKDRRQGDDVVAEVDEGVHKMQGFVKALELEIKERSALIDLLEQADSFYENQKGEAKVVANAYRNFGSRVKNLKRRLDELLPTLKDISPIPSPDINAPSPSPADSDIELPDENDNTGSVGESFFSSLTSKSHVMKTGLQDEPQQSSQQHSLDNCFSSFMGTALPFDLQRNPFSETSREAILSPSPVQPLEDSGGVPGLSTLPASEGKPIEVINSRTKPDEGFNVAEFLKALIPSASSPIIPGLNMDPPPQNALTQNATKSMYSSATDLNSTSQYDYATEPPSTPLQPPPPLPPSLFPLEEPSYKYGQSMNREEDAWNTKLPPKFPTWGDTAPGWEREESEKTTEWMPVLPPNKVTPIALDTPESPPLYEKEGFSDPVEYDDSVVEPTLMSSSGDVDHRTLVPLPQINHTKDNDCRIPPPVKHMKDTDHRVILPVTPANHTKKDMDHRPMIPRKKDVDHRNLISLTGSPVRDHSSLPPPPTPPTLNWSHSDQDYRPAITTNTTSKKELLQQGDQDYRLHQPHSVVRRQLDETQDNVESVDMEMSDEEMAEPAVMENISIENLRENKEMILDKDKGFNMSHSNKPVISFNINSHSKVLVNSPLNEVKEDSKPRSRGVYGCQKIPTISGIGGNTHSPRGMGPRPRVPLLSSPLGVKRLPPPNLPRGFRPSMMAPPPPLPPLRPLIMPQPESFNVTIEIKPQAEIESQNANQETEPCLDFVVEEEVVTEPPPPPPPLPPPPLPESLSVEKEKPVLKVNDKKQGTDELDKEKAPTEVNRSISVTEDMQTERNAEDSKNHDGEQEKDEAEATPVEQNASQSNTVPEIGPVVRVETDHLKHTKIEASEHWMNNELAELEQIDMARMEQDRIQRGRGRPPFKNFPRGGFIPRARPMWNGPRRGGPPPARFPFRPPLDRPFGRGHRGGFRPPFRGNRGPFGGW